METAPVAAVTVSRNKEHPVETERPAPAERTPSGQASILVVQAGLPQGRSSGGSTGKPATRRKK
jgi:hypothetical protein